MATIINLDDRRPKPEPMRAPNLMAGVTRTPELALIMALYAQVPRKYRGPALTSVMMMADRKPDCEASQQAGRIAALLALQATE